MADLPAPKERLSIEEFAAIDLRVARILHAEEIVESNKLVRLEIDVGALGRRTVLAGIKGAYRPDELIGTLVVVVANLEPRTMRFGTSEAMLLAASAPEGRPRLVHPEPDAEPGQRVR